MGRTLRAALPGAVGVVAVVLLAGCLWADVSYLSGDGLAGRQNGTAGSVQAQDHLIDRLQGWGPGPNRAATGRGAYVQTFGTGANVLGVVPGTDLAHEYVIVGAHYDGQPDECRSVEPGDLICNGATDNATGVAAVLEVGRRLADAPVRQRRSVILAFWDAEEEGRVGSRHYVANPLVPLSATVAYVNLDIQGANLRPSIRNTTFAIGSETGGPTLQQALAAASTASTLDTRPLSLVFGQGRSDHAEFVSRGIPIVFFTDSTGPCYHTTADDVDVVDFAKLDQQVNTLHALVRDLAVRPTRPPFVSGGPVATCQDAVQLSTVLTAAIDDLATFSPQAQVELRETQPRIKAIVDAGPAAFDDADRTALLVAASSAVQHLTYGPCRAFLAGG